MDEITKKEYYHEKLRDENLEDHKQELPIRVRQDEQQFAACDGCNTKNTFDRYQYRGKTYCEACLEQMGIEV